MLGPNSYVKSSHAILTRDNYDLGIVGGFITSLRLLSRLLCTY